MMLIKQKNGNYIPYDDYDYEESKKIAVGKVVKATKLRNYKHLKKSFALLKVGFDNQEAFDSFDVYRKVMTIRAGYYDTVQNTKKDGFTPIPKSISFEKMNQEDFNNWYDDTMKVVSQDLGITVAELEGEI